MIKDCRFMINEDLKIQQSQINNHKSNKSLWKHIL